jgi:hypothetical protein
MRRRGARGGALLPAMPHDDAFRVSLVSQQTTHRRAVRKMRNQFRKVHWRGGRRQASRGRHDPGEAGPPQRISEKPLRLTTHGRDRSRQTTLRHIRSEIVAQEWKRLDGGNTPQRENPRPAERFTYCMDESKVPCANPASSIAQRNFLLCKKSISNSFRRASRCGHRYDRRPIRLQSVRYRQARPRTGREWSPDARDSRPIARSWTVVSSSHSCELRYRP